MSETWYLDNCTNIDGTNKKEGLYSNIIGTECLKPLAVPDNRMLIEFWNQKEKGKIYGSILTSMVVATYNEGNNKIVVQTQNTIYTFKKIQK